MNSKSVTRILALAALLFVTTLPAVAQEKHKLNRYLDSILSVRYQRADIDTHYVVRPDKKWTLTGRLNVSGARIMGKGIRDGEPFETRMTADYKTTVCVGVSYLGLSAVFSSPYRGRDSMENWPTKVKFWTNRIVGWISK